MALVPLRTILDHAAENDYGVAAFNVNIWNKFSQSWKLQQRQIPQ